MSSRINSGQDYNSTISLWDPVKYGQYAQTSEHKALECVDEYFRLKDRVAVVAAAPVAGSPTPIHFQQEPLAFFLTVLKVISYATVVIPLIMFIAKCILHLKYQFQPLPSGPNGALTGPGATTSAANDPTAAKLLKDYKIGNSAQRCSELMLKIHSNIPNPDDLQLYTLPFSLAKLGDVEIIDEEDGRVKRVGNDIIQYYDNLINQQNPRSPWEDRFLKMTIHIHDAIMKLQGDELQSARAVLAGALINAFAHCTNRKSTEIERLYDLYVIPELLATAQEADMPQETLLYEFMNCRMKNRDEIINTKCPDAHNAASHRYFRKKLDEAVFYLPPPPLCAEDERFASYAMQDQENAIIQAFRTYYHDPKTIYDIFAGLIYPKSGEKFQYKHDMFATWLQEDPDRAANAFDEENYTAYKPEIIIAFLVEKGFLAPK